MANGQPELPGVVVEHEVVRGDGHDEGADDEVSTGQTADEQIGRRVQTLVAH